MFVDDIVITGLSNTEIDLVVSQLQQYFSLRDLGQLDYFLGISVKPTSYGLLLSQEKYIMELLTKADMKDARSLPTPMTASTSLFATTGSVFEDPSLYRSIVGGLQYCTITRPDLSFSVNKVCQFMANP